LLAVEGKDEEIFFECLLEHLQLTDILVLPVGGKTKFGEAFNVLKKTRGFSSLQSIAVIQDADLDGDNAFKSVSNILRKNNFVPPNARNMFSNSAPRCGVFIMPGQNSKTGKLEDLCLEIANETDDLSCVDAFWNCVASRTPPPKDKAKTKVQAYLSSMDKEVPSIGIAARKKIWSFKSKAIQELISFVKDC
jgi:hypothetical protein